MDPRLIRLRVELFSAAQLLTGEDAEEFWTLLEEVQSIHVAHKTSPTPRGATGA